MLITSLWVNVSFFWSSSQLHLSVKLFPFFFLHVPSCMSRICSLLVFWGSFLHMLHIQYCPYNYRLVVCSSRCTFPSPFMIQEACIIKPVLKNPACNTCNKCFWFLQDCKDMAWNYKSLSLVFLKLDANFACYAIQRFVKFCLFLIK